MLWSSFFSTSYNVVIWVGWSCQISTFSSMVGSTTSSLFFSKACIKIWTTKRNEICPHGPQIHNKGMDIDQDSHILKSLPVKFWTFRFGNAVYGAGRTADNCTESFCKFVGGLHQCPKKLLERDFMYLRHLVDDNWKLLVPFLFSQVEMKDWRWDELLNNVFQLFDSHSIQRSRWKQIGLGLFPRAKNSHQQQRRFPCRQQTDGSGPSLWKGHSPVTVLICTAVSLETLQQYLSPCSLPHPFQALAL